MDTSTLLFGVVVFFARVTDVTLGTVRTLSIVQGRTKTAFMLGFVEVTVWIWVVAKVLQLVAQEPILTVFYALGFASGNVVGITVERHLAYGYAVLRVICPDSGMQIAESLRNAGYAATTFLGEGLSGPVTMVYVVCLRKELTEIVARVKEVSPDAFYIVEAAASVSKIYRPYLVEQTGWRAILKRK